MINIIIQEIIEKLKISAPNLTPEQISWRKKIINSTNPNFFSYGHKISEIEKISKDIQKKYNCNYQDALFVFKNLVISDVEEEKFAGMFFLNLFKANFNQNTLITFKDALLNSCDTWAFCDSLCIRVIGPFLGKNDKRKIAENVIEIWSKSENLWVIRASIVILLKIIMINKEFDEDYVYNFVGSMLKFPEDYIQKAIGWLLKTCSKYKPESIFQYLMDNKNNFSRLILRYASEKLSDKKRMQLLNKG